MEKYKILIIEDELRVSKILSMYFEKESFQTELASNGEEGLELFKNFKPNLVVLDIMMPVKDGWQVAKEIRDNSDVPIVIMTALSSEDDVLKGYNLKIDDYVVKPVNPKILVAKVKAILERRYPKKVVSDEISIGAIKINVAEHRAFLDKEEIKLSKTEFDLLLYFIKNNNKVCSRQTLLEKVWGETIYIDDRIIDTYVKNLRKLLKGHDYIKTIFGIGYRFEA